MNDNYIPEGHVDAEFATVGTIIFNDIIEEKEIVDSARRFKPKSIGECKIEIYPNEGQVPHFHIYNLTKTFQTCICIYSNNYFSHGGKYKDKFNSRQCEQLNEWLANKNKNSYVGVITNWAMIEALWNTFNPECKFPEYRKVKTQPDYSKMINFKDN